MKIVAGEREKKSEMLGSPEKGGPGGRRSGEEQIAIVIIIMIIIIIIFCDGQLWPVRVKVNSTSAEQAHQRHSTNIDHSIKYNACL